MIMHLEKMTSYICDCAGKNYCGETAEWRERENEREKGERVKDCVLLEKGLGIAHKFDCWSNFSGVRKG
jgi:hypothetical protein